MKTAYTKGQKLTKNQTEEIREAIFEKPIETIFLIGENKFEFKNKK